MIGGFAVIVVSAGQRWNFVAYERPPWSRRMLVPAGWRHGGRKAVAEGNAPSGIQRAGGSENWKLADDR